MEALSNYLLQVQYAQASSHVVIIPMFPTFKDAWTQFLLCITSSKLAVKCNLHSCMDSEGCRTNTTFAQAKANLKASKHFPQTIILWCCETAGGILQLSSALPLGVRTVQWTGPARTRGAPTSQLRGKAGSHRNGPERARLCLSGNLFLSLQSVCRQAEMTLRKPCHHCLKRLGSPSI